MADGSIASFAGIWERWGGAEGPIESFSTTTTEATPELAHVHGRQPAIVDPNRFEDWLDPDAPKEALLGVVGPPHPGPYEIRPVSPLVTNTRKDGPEVFEAPGRAEFPDPPFRTWPGPSNRMPTARTPMGGPPA